MVKEHKGRAKGVNNRKTVAVARAKLVADGVIARALVVPSRRSGARLKAQPGISLKDLMLSNMRDRWAAAHALNTEALACHFRLTVGARLPRHGIPWLRGVGECLRGGINVLRGAGVGQDLL
jgi:hypothetical protein